MSELIPSSLSRVYAAKQSQSSHKIFWGVVTAVNNENQTMDVSISDKMEPEVITVSINNMSSQAAGIRFSPLPKNTIALLYENAGKYHHIGYYYSAIDDNGDLSGSKDFTDNREATKQTSGRVILQRYLESGEVQLTGINNNEVLLSVDGSVLIKDSNDSFIKLESYTGTLQGNFENLQFGMDGTRIRSGNIKRPINPDTAEDEYIVDVDGTVMQESSMGEDDEATNLKEFTVQVGTVQDLEGIDTASSPSVGTLSMATKVIGEDGIETMSAGQNLQFDLQMASGGGIGIAEDGSVLIKDKRGGTVTKFTVGNDGEKSLRVDKNIVSVDKTNGIMIQHESGAMILLNPAGEIHIMRNGKGITIDANGTTIDASKSTLTLKAKDLNIFGTCKFGGMTVDGLLPALLTASFLDAHMDGHIHAGPSGPRLPVPLPYGIFTGMVTSGALKVAGMDVSI